MNQRFFLLFTALFALLFSFFTPAYAAPDKKLVEVFQQSFPQKGKFTENFSAPTTQGTWYLTVAVQGSPNASLKAGITLNGQSVVTENDYHHSYNRLRKIIAIQANNTLVIDRSGSPGGNITVTISGFVPAGSLPSGAGQAAFNASALFGSKTYVRQNGPSTTYQDNFSLPTTKGLYWLEITNPAPGTTKIASATISLNGKDVFFPENFDGSGPTAQSRPVLVKKNNRLDVVLNSQPGSALSIKVRAIVIDESPPSLTIDKPSPGEIFNTPPDVKTSYSDDISGIDKSTFRATLNGTDISQAFTVGDSQATASLSGVQNALVQGENELVVSIQDKAGKESSESVKFIFDTIPPKFTLTPAQNQIVTTPIPSLKVEYTDPSPGTGTNTGTLQIKLDGQDITSKFNISSTEATYTLTLNEKLAVGQHTFSAEIKDQAGNTGQSTITFTAKDIDPPNLTITKPQPGEIFNTPPGVLASYSDIFSGIDTSSFQAILNGTNVTASLAAGSSQVTGDLSSASASLVQGQNTLTLKISDHSGNTTSKNVSFIYDTTKPVITSISPAGGSFINDNTPQIQIAYNDAHSGIDTAGFQASLNGQNVSSSFTVGTNGASFQISSALPEGENTLSVTIADQAGNTQSQTVKFTVDTVAPSLATTPADGDTIFTPTPTLKIDYNDPAPASGLDLSSLVIKLDGTDITSKFTAGANSTSYTLSQNEQLTVGNHTLEVSLTDQAGNRNQITSTFEAKDNTPPTLSLNQPPQNGVFSAAPNVDATYQDSFSGIDQASFKATLNGIDITSTLTVTTSQTTGNLSNSQSALAQGQNTLTVEISDQAGNTSNASVVFIYDTTAPTVSVSPADNAKIKDATPLLDITYTDGESGIEPSTFQATLNNNNITSSFNVTNTGASYQITSNLPEGQNSLVVSITDKAGNTQNTTINFFVDTVSPAVSIATPADGSTIYDGTPTFQVNYSDPAPSSGVDLNSLVITLDGQDITSSFTLSSNGATFTPGQDLSEGQHSLVVSLNDEAGNQKSVSSTFEFVEDLVAPTMQITSPGDGSFHNTAPGVVVTYSDSISGVDLSTFKATLNGTDITQVFTPVSAQATADLFSVQTTLTEGQNTIAVEITDLAGNTATTSLNFIYDTTKPTIQSLTPLNGTVLSQNITEIKVTYNDGGSGIDVGNLKFFVNGLDRTSAFTITATSASLQIDSNSPLSEGSNSVIATIVDQAGNSISQSTSFTVDTQDPSLGLTPTEGEVINTFTPTLRVDYSDPTPGSGLDLSTLVVTLDGNDFSAKFNKLSDHATYTLTSSEALSEGSHTLAAEIKDQAGNTRTISVTFQVTQSVNDLNIEITPVSGSNLLAEKFHNLSLTATNSAGDPSLGYTGFVILRTDDPGSNLNNLLLEFKSSHQGVIDLPKFAFFSRAGNIAITAQDVSRENINGQASITVLSPQGNTLVFEEGGQDITIGKGESPPASVVAVKDPNGQGVSNIKINVKMTQHQDQVLQTDAFGQAEIDFGALSKVGVYKVEISSPGLNPLSQTITVLGPDTTAPLVSILPADGTVAASQPPINIQYSDFATGLDLGTLVIEIDGTDRTGDFTVEENKATFIPESPLSDGPHTIEVSVQDIAGNKAEVTSNFTVNSGQTLTVAANSSLNQTAIAGSATGNPLVVKVTDPNGNPVYGATLEFQITQGVGKLSTLDGREVVVTQSPSPPLLVTTDQNGNATTLLYATTTDPITVTATIQDTTQTLTFNVNVLPEGTQVDFNVTFPSSVQAGEAFDITFTVSPSNYVGNLVLESEAVNAPNDGQPIYTFPTPAVSFDGTNATQTVSNVKLAQAGDQIIRVSDQAGSFSSFNLDSIQVTSGPAASITKVAGDNQIAITSSELPEKFQVEIEDQFGNPVSGEKVKFEITQGGQFGGVASRIGTVATFAGGGSQDVTTSETITQIQRPAAIAFDQDGNLYIADSDNERVRKVDRITNVITTVAGTGGSGFSGDGGLAINAQLNSPAGLAIDSNNNLFVGDQFNHVIRKVDLSTGIITTVGGVAGVEGGTSDKLANPAHLAFGSDERYLYIEDGPLGSTNPTDRIRKLDLQTGTISTVLSGRDLIRDIEIQGNLIYFIEQNSIKYFQEGGSVNTLIGQAGQGFSSDGTPASQCRIDTPFGMSLDKNGNLYFSDSLNHIVRVVLASDNKVYTVAGTTDTRGSGGEGPAINTTFNVPAECEYNPVTNELAIFDFLNHKIRSFPVSGNSSGYIYDVAGNGSPGYNGDAILATEASLLLSEDFIFTLVGISNSSRLIGYGGFDRDSDGNIYLAETARHRIIKVDKFGNTSVFAGTGEAGHVDGDVTAAKFNFPTDLVVDGSGNIFVTDTLNHHIRKITSQGQVETIAGNGSRFAGSNVSDPALQAVVAHPTRIELDQTSGTLYFMTYPLQGGKRLKKLESGTVTQLIENNNFNEYSDLFLNNNDLYLTTFTKVVKLDLSSNPITITEVAGADQSGFVDGVEAASAHFNNPFGLTMDSSGRIYIGDTFNHRIRILTSSGFVHTIAGTGEAGFNGEEGEALFMQINSPSSLLWFSEDLLYFVDTENDRLRKIVFPENTKTILIPSGDNGLAIAEPYVTGLVAGTEKIAVSLPDKTSIASKEFSVGVQAPDNLPPTVVATEPADGEQKVRININRATVEFSDFMKESTLDSAVKLKLNGIEVSTTTSYDILTKTFSFHLSNDLNPGTTYTIEVTTAAQDLSGNPLSSPFTATFTTTSPEDSLPPEVTFTDPPANTINIFREGKINVGFSKDMDPSTINTTNIVVEEFDKDTGLWNPVFGQVGYDETKQTATFESSGLLGPGKMFRLTLLEGIRDDFGYELVVNDPFTFISRTNTQELDSDGDGLLDVEEAVYGTDPGLADSDGDGLSDLKEIFETGTDPLRIDTDLDGITDNLEGPDNDIESMPDLVDVNNIEILNFRPSSGLNVPVNSVFSVEFTKAVNVSSVQSHVRIGTFTSGDIIRDEDGNIIDINVAPLSVTASQGSSVTYVNIQTASPLPADTPVAMVLDPGIESKINSTDVTTTRKLAVYRTEPQAFTTIVPQEPCGSIILTPSQYVGSSFNVIPVTGNAIYSNTDVSLPSRGAFGTTISRTYRAQKSEIGAFGRGWSFNLDRRMEEISDPNDSRGDVGDVIFHVPDGRAFKYGQTASGYKTPCSFFDTLYTATSLEINGNTITGNFFVQRKKHGTRRVYDRNNDGFLIYMIDRNGNALELTRNSQGRLTEIKDDLGRTTTIDYYPQGDVNNEGLIQKITDFSGRVWEYDYSEKNLISVTFPTTTFVPEGANSASNGVQTVNYQYAPDTFNSPLDHNLIAVFDRRGNNTLLVNYDDRDRVTSYDTPSGSVFYTYDAENAITSVLERDGDITEHDHYVTNDHRRGLLKKHTVFEDSEIIETHFDYDNQHQLSEITKPKGNIVRFIYDELGNLLQRIHKTSSTSVPEDDLVYSWTYEPVYNMVRSYTEPRGNAAPVVSFDSNNLEDIRNHTPRDIIIDKPEQRDAYTSYFFYDHEDIEAEIALLEANFNNNVDISVQGPVPPTYGRPGGGTADNRDPNVFKDTDGDGIVDHGGNLYIIRSPRPREITPSGDTFGFASTRQQIESFLTYNSWGQNIFALGPLAEDIIDKNGTVSSTAKRARIRREFHTTADDLANGHIKGFVKSTFVDSAIGPHDVDLATGIPSGTADTTRFNYESKVKRNIRGAVTSTTDPRGNTTTFTLSNHDRLLEVTAPSPFEYKVHYDYDGNDNLVRIEVQNSVALDTNGNGIQDNASEQDNSLSSFVHTMRYDQQNNLILSVLDKGDGTHIKSRNEYNADELLIRTIYPEGNWDEIQYNARDLVVKTIAGASDSSTASTTQFTYDKNSNLTNIYDDDGDFDAGNIPVSFTYDGFDRQKKVIDEDGNEVEAFYNHASQVIRQVVRGKINHTTASNSVLAQSFMEYDELGRVFQVDADHFDVENRTAKPGGIITPPVPSSSRIGVIGNLASSVVIFNERSQVLKAVNAKGQESTSTYDNLGRPVTATDNIGNSVEYTYNNNSQVISTLTREVSTDGSPAEEFKSFAFYDELGRLHASMDNLGNVSRMLYDSRSNVIEVSDAQSDSTQTLGAALSVLDRVGEHSTSSFPSHITDVNQRGNTTSYTYDGISRLLKTEKHLRAGGTGDGSISSTITTQNEWDDNSRLIAAIDSAGNRTEYAYDHQNRMIKIKFPDLTTNRVTYNKVSDVVKSVDARGVVTNYTYDALSRVTRKDFSNLPYGANQTTFEEFGYDGASRLNYAANDFASSSFKYSSFSYLLKDTQTIGGFSLSLNNTYDVLGNRKSVQYPSGNTYTKSYDKINRCKEIEDGTGIVSKSEHIGPGYRKLNREFGNGIKLHHAYDKLRRPIRRDYRRISDSQRITGYSYKWDRVGNRTVERELTRNTNPTETSGQGRFYTYDSAYRLRDAYRNVLSSSLDTYTSNSADFTSPGTGDKTSYQIDDLGNRKSVTTDNDPPITYDLLDSNQSQDNSMNRYTFVGGTRQTYDRQGNLIKDGLTQYWYDAANRLTQYISGDTGKEVRFQYGPLGRRVRKQTDVNDPSKDTLYWYDGDEVVEETDAAGNIQREYVYGEGIDQVLRVRSLDFADSDGDGSTSDFVEFYYHTNSIGTVVALTDADGGVVERYEYGHFGELEKVTSGDGTTEHTRDGKPYSPTGNEYFFQGRRLDPETGLYYFRARYYNAAVGRFLSRDPLLYVDGMNPYQAFGGNPVNFVDPWGENAQKFQEIMDSMPQLPKGMQPYSTDDWKYINEIKEWLSSDSNKLPPEMRRIVAKRLLKQNISQEWPPSRARIEYWQAFEKWAKKNKAELATLFRPQDKCDHENPDGILMTPEHALRLRSQNLSFEERVQIGKVMTLIFADTVVDLYEGLYGYDWMEGTPLSKMEQAAAIGFILIPIGNAKVAREANEQVLKRLRRRNLREGLKKAKTAKEKELIECLKKAVKQKKQLNSFPDETIWRLAGKYGTSVRHVKHALAHIDQFRNLDKSISPDKMFMIANDVLKNPGITSQYKFGKLSSSIKNINGKIVQVHVVTNKRGRIRTIFIKE